jgi:hypothetical protein
VNVVDLRAQLELDLTWRATELVFLHNQISSLDKEDDRNLLRRFAVVMLYAHFEGFTKTALSIYADAINAEQVEAIKAHEAIAALTLSDALRTLCNPDRKSDLFRRALPHDGELHRFARQREFVERWRDFSTMVVSIPIDDVVDTESNLRPVVLRKCLYRLGLDASIVDNYGGVINELLNRRNAVAHGSSKEGVQEVVYGNLHRRVTELMEALILAIISAVENRTYLSVA